MILTLVLIVASIGAYFFYKYGTKDYDFFVKRGLPSATPSFLFGNRPIFGNKLSAPEFIKMYYDKFAKEKVFGLFDVGQPVIILKHPEIIRQLAIKDFDSFVNHRVVFDEKLDPLFGNSLISLQGQKWRDMRATLSPAFTGSKMRQMFELITVCGDNLVKYFLEQNEKNGTKEYEVKDIFTRFANDLIATSAFGLQVDSFKEKDNEFYTNGRQLTDFTSPVIMLKFAGYALIPKLMKAFNIRLFSKTISDYFTNIITDSIKYRIENKVFRPDMLNLLINVKQGTTEKNQEPATNSPKDGFATVEESHVGKAVVKREWTDDEIIAQCFLFFLAGFDTVSTALSFLSYEIATNPDVEEKLFKEVQQVNDKLQGKLLTYDDLQSMKYMDMVISESLRKWPPAPMTDRVCVRDYEYQDEDGLKFKIEKGDNYWIPIYGLHHDPQYFPNPDKFDPERFSEENKHNINLNVYLPFGVGPRNCIGSRFALMEIKTVLYYLVNNFKFQTTEKTQIPLKFAKRMFGVASEKGVWLEFEPRTT